MLNLEVQGGIDPRLLFGDQEVLWDNAVLRDEYLMLGQDATPSTLSPASSPVCSPPPLLNKSWVDICSQAIKNLIEGTGHKRLMFHYQKDICKYIDEHWELLCPEKARTPTWCRDFPRPASL